MRVSSHFLSTIFLTACMLNVACAPQEGMKRILLTDGEASVRVDVEIADKPSEYAQGLMGRKDLPEGRGMLFVFYDEVPRAFWMKNTLIPLDILFFDAERQLVHIEEMTPCRNVPCPRYSSDKPAKYALEVGAGFVQEHRIGEGWMLQR